jgi:hypothetical protein
VCSSDLSFDAGVLSNVVRINGIVSSQIINVSSLNANAVTSVTVTSVTGTVSSFTTNALTIGTGGGFISIPFIQSILVSTIQINNTQLNTSNVALSSINTKMPPFWSTLNVPASSFVINGIAAGTPIVLYSNVQFPPYTKGMYKIYQKAILTKNTGGANVDAHGSIFYTQGLYPSTTTFLDGYSALPYANENGISTYTTCVSMCLISTATTRNISYYDGASNNYTATIFMGNLAVEYIPSFGNATDAGINITF